ncbi:hypothetical protein F441_17739 [Phytophthora nicotianae CJ01A1]|uniref:Major facilitator superfamily (MFS) profile domain-containing protein n=6 Tax=Phytophthora nicotianae TaxID=4792 RepID=W2I5X2_PHYNI|nr:hypothetical protein L916_17282 [Phytophthora nicotianae]ETL82801.1 hypothetical protein L917_17113 [Phytophthora nicotianae]ETM36011.1 hypothetical protein L914_17182 [Phytophthora nicotianae]ETP05706.1 hypothetical protein F441_17739 [Phytophthora nicotianae CJ01A1]
MERNSADMIKPTQKRGMSCKFIAIVGLQFLAQASFGFMSPILTIVTTEYYARHYRDGLPIDCGANPHKQACIDGSRQAAWLSSIYLAVGSVLSFFLSPMLGQASDIYGRKRFLVLSQIARVGLPFSVAYFMQAQGSIIPYFVLRLIDNAFEYEDFLLILSNRHCCNLFCVFFSRTGGVINAAATDIVSPDYRATAFGLLSASVVVGYCSSAFVAPFFSRDVILQITAGIFILRVAWAMVIVPETLPARTHKSKTRWTVENPFSSISILFRSKLFITLAILIALTSVVSEGTFQIQTFYLNTVVGFDMTDFGNLMLFNGVLAVIGQGLLLDPLVKCVQEQGVIIMAQIGSFLSTLGIVGTAFYPHKWLVYMLSVPDCVSQLSFPAISALMSFSTPEEEQGRLQGAIYAAQSVFAAIGPVVFSLLYTAMTKKSQWSQAFPFVIASVIYLVGVGLAFSLKVVGDSIPSDTASTASSNDEDNDNCEPEMEEGGKIDQIISASNTAEEDEQSLTQPLLGTRLTSTRYFTEV